MVKHAIDAALLRRNPYLRMVIARDGVADGAIVVAAVHAILAFRPLLEGLGLFIALRVVLGGLVMWIILSGLVYLVGRHALEGEGTFPGTMAAVSIGIPVLLAALLLAPLLGPLAAALLVSLWLLATLWVAAGVALELEAGRAAIAALGGWAAFVVVTSIFRL